jgi:hypothetical protein
MKKKFSFDLLPYAAQVLAMVNNRIEIAFIYQTRINVYEKYEIPYVEYFLVWQDPDDGDEQKNWFPQSKVFETREALLASL